jgi:hypothetical protein
MSAHYKQKADLVEEQTVEESFVPMSEKESEMRLKGKKAGAYLLRQDPSGDLYLTGIGSEGKFHHAWLERKGSIWVGLNGGNLKKRHYQGEYLKNIATQCLNCTEKELELVVDEG